MGRMVETRSCVQREGVYRWFSALTSAKRAEFLCGLLDLCVPIELRFLGSCLEDLARKDYHSLRDAEIKANNPTDLSGLANITDEVVRSKLLVSVALLASDNREAAGVLYRTLTHIDTVINNYGLSLNDGRTEEQFLLLFTMASHHPAFTFHQKQVLRQQLDQIHDIFQVNRGGGGGCEEAGGGVEGAVVGYPPSHQPCQHQHQALALPVAPVPPSADAHTLPACQRCHTHCPCCHTREPSAVPPLGSGVRMAPDQEERQELRSPRPEPHPHPHPPAPPPSHTPLPSPPSPAQEAAAAGKDSPGKAVKVVEKVLLRGLTHTSEDNAEYLLEARWSDGLVSSVVRTQQDVTELLSQLSRAFPEEELEQWLPQAAEVDPRCLTALPAHVLQHCSVQLFFTSTRPPSHPHPAAFPSSPAAAPGGSACTFSSHSSLGCMLQYRGATRAVYRVASVQPVISTYSPVLQPPSPRLPSLPPPPHKYSSLPPSVLALPTQCPLVASSEPSSQMHPYPPLQHHLQPHMSSQSGGQHHPSPHCQSQSQSQSQTQTQTLSNSQARSQAQPQTQTQPSTPEQSGILDWLRRLRLHKYYPVFKQLTMEEFLGLTEEDLNKYDLTQGAKKKLKTQLELQKSFDREMKLEKQSSVARVTPSTHLGSPACPASPAELRVDVDSHTPPVSDSSSSGNSSSSCSPRTPLYCDPTLDRTKDVHRRLAGPDVPGGGLDGDQSCQFPLSSSCPTGSVRPTAQVLPVQTDSALLPSPSGSLSLTQASHQPPSRDPQSSLTAYRRSWLPQLSSADDRTKLQAPSGGGAGASFSGGGAGASFSGGGGGGVMRQESLFSRLNMDRSLALQDSLLCPGLAGTAVGLMVETSSAITSTSNSLHHVSHPPLHFHLSSSSPPSPSGYYSCLPISISLHPSSSGGAGVAVAAASGNPHHPRPPASSILPSSASSLHQSPAATPSVCACSSCGCQEACGAYGAFPGYAVSGYLQPLSAEPPLFSLGPLVHLSPLIATSNSGATSFSYPIMVPSPVYGHAPASHDQHQGVAFYQPHTVIGNGGQKRGVGSLSCYNCGSNGHKAEACKQPSMEPPQQGTFRLKYHPHSDSKNSRD